MKRRPECQGTVLCATAGAGPLGLQNSELLPEDLAKPQLPDLGSLLEFDSLGAPGVQLQSY